MKWLLCLIYLLLRTEAQGQELEPVKLSAKHVLGHLGLDRSNYIRNIQRSGDGSRLFVEVELKNGEIQRYTIGPTSSDKSVQSTTKQSVREHQFSSEIFDVSTGRVLALTQLTREPRIFSHGNSILVFGSIHMKGLTKLRLACDEFSFVGDKLVFSRRQSFSQAEIFFDYDENSQSLLASDANDMFPKLLLISLADGTSRSLGSADRFAFFLSPELVAKIRKRHLKAGT